MHAVCVAENKINVWLARVGAIVFFILLLLYYATDDDVQAE